MGDEIIKDRAITLRGTVKETVGAVRIMQGLKTKPTIRLWNIPRNIHERGRCEKVAVLQEKQSMNPELRLNGTGRH
jgi:hypothetical protein